MLMFRADFFLKARNDKPEIAPGTRNPKNTETKDGDCKIIAGIIAESFVPLNGLEPLRSCPH